MTSQLPFAVFYDQALAQVESEEALQALMPMVRTLDEFLLISDDRYLAAICLRVFRAGLKHSLVDKLWPNFESAFHQFEPAVLADLSDEELEQLMNQKGVIKHWGKVKSIRANARFIFDISSKNGSFGQWLASWPSADIVGLWLELATQGSHLGGKSGAYFLRYMGKDTFLLSEDVVAVLTDMGVIEGNPFNKKNLSTVQRLFNQWHMETGLAYSHLSRILSLTHRQ